MSNKDNTFHSKVLHPTGPPIIVIIIIIIIIYIYTDLFTLHVSMSSFTKTQNKGRKNEERRENTEKEEDRKGGNSRKPGGFHQLVQRSSIRKEISFASKLMSKSPWETSRSSDITEIKSLGTSSIKCSNSFDLICDLPGLVPTNNCSLLKRVISASFETVLPILELLPLLTKA